MALRTISFLDTVRDIPMKGNESITLEWNPYQIRSQTTKRPIRQTTLKQEATFHRESQERGFFLDRLGKSVTHLRKPTKNAHLCRSPRCIHKKVSLNTSCVEGTAPMRGGESPPRRFHSALQEGWHRIRTREGGGGKEGRKGGGEGEGRRGGRVAGRLLVLQRRSHPLPHVGCGGY